MGVLRMSAALSLTTERGARAPAAGRAPGRAPGRVAHLVVSRPCRGRATSLHVRHASGRAGRKGSMRHSTPVNDQLPPVGFEPTPTTLLGSLPLPVGLRGRPQSYRGSANSGPPTKCRQEFLFLSPKFCPNTVQFFLVASSNSARG